MTEAALQLIHEVTDAGGRLAIRGDKLHVSAPSSLPDELMGRLRQRKPEIIEALIGGDRRGDDASLVRWFLNTEPPAKPFQLHQGVWIAHPARWWASLHDDIAVGPGKGRARYGALQKDLRRLAELLDGPDER